MLLRSFGHGCEFLADPGEVLHCLEVASEVLQDQFVGGEGQGTEGGLFRWDGSGLSGRAWLGLRLHLRYFHMITKACWNLSCNAIGGSAGLYWICGNGYQPNGV